MSTLKFKCPRCGGMEFKTARKDIRLTDTITCAKCGHSGTARSIVTPQAKKYAEDVFKKALKALR